MRAYTVYVGWVSAEAKSRADSLRLRASRLGLGDFDDRNERSSLLNQAQQVEEDGVSWRLLRHPDGAKKIVEFPTRRKAMGRIRKLRLTGHSYIRLVKPDGELEVA